MFAVGAGYKNSTPSAPPLAPLSPMDGASHHTPTLDYHQHHETPGHMFVHVAEAVIQPVILSIGIITNILSLIVLRRTHIGSVFKICITSLTISDLCASIFGFSQILVEVIAFNGNIPFGYYHPESIASHTLYYLFLIFMCTSSGLVILIVVIRSVMVAKPMSSRKYLTSKRVKIFCALVAIVTSALFLPTGLNIMWEVCYRDFYQNDICPMFEHVEWVFKYLYALTVLYGPILIIIYIVCFVLIKTNLNKANKEAEGMMNSDINASEIQSRIQQTVKVTKILMAILILDCICVVPTCLQGIGLIIAPDDFVFDKTYALANVIDVICEIFLCCRPTVNFSIYVCMHKEFRRQCGILFGQGRLWAQTTLGDMVPSAIRSNSDEKGALNEVRKDSGAQADSQNVTQSTTVDSMQLTPVLSKKEPATSAETTSLLNKVSAIPEDTAVQADTMDSCDLDTKPKMEASDLDPQSRLMTQTNLNTSPDIC